MDDKHFHIWTRAGRTFLMGTRRYTTRSHANKDAVAARPAAADRMVRECSKCPASTRSKRRPPSWSRVAADVAAAMNVDPAALRAELERALEAERAR